MNVDQTTIDIFKKYGGDAKADLWEFKRGAVSMHIAKHKALERIAGKAGITFDPPDVFESNLAEQIVGVTVTGHLGEDTAWSMGEAAPYNNKMGYPAAMAEKRAKDRVILKLLGIHGEVYSDIEADDFKSKPMTKAEGRDAYSKLVEEMRSVVNSVALTKWREANASRVNALPADWVKAMKEEFDICLKALLENETGAKVEVRAMEKIR